MPDWYKSTETHPEFEQWISFWDFKIGRVIRAAQTIGQATSKNRNCWLIFKGMIRFPSLWQKRRRLPKQRRFSS